MNPDLNKLTKIFRNNRELAYRITQLIHKYMEKLKEEKKFEKIKIMNFCGTHEWTTVHYGIRSIIPPEVMLVAGPGCPVCITPSVYIEEAIKLSLDGVKVYVFGDAYKLPTVKKVRGVNSLAEARSINGDVEIVYSFLDAIKNYKTKNTNKEAIFLGIGFETTSPSYAVPIYTRKLPKKFYFLSILRLTPPAADYALKAAIDRGLEPIKGIIAPGHVSTVIGAKAWRFIGEKYGIPAVVSGFEPIDLLLSVLMILKMLREEEYDVKIEYKRIVSDEGNLDALDYMYKVFDVETAPWRGIGFIEKSGLNLKEEFSQWDAYKTYNIENISEKEFLDDLHPSCRCAEIVLGLKNPRDCPLFLKACTPDRPMGPCMVSIEGTCSVWAKFGGGGLVEDIIKSMDLR